MDKKDLSIQRLKNTEFPKVYKEFILNKVEDYDYTKIITCALLFLNSETIYIQKLGYSIIVEYCNRTQNYTPLYEIAMNLGLYPIAKYIKKYISPQDGSVFSEMNESFIENYNDNGIYQSQEQKELTTYFKDNLDKSISVVAPTSYGKTELILSLLSDASDKNICIITPTKSLLAQTKQRIYKAKIKSIGKIITHPEMYNKNDKKITAVLTQERLLRLLKKSPDIAFDYIIIDEAHNLLHKGDREILLASVVILLEKRNPNLIVKLLTPFVKDSKNIEVKFTNLTLREFCVNEFIKSERIFIYDSKESNGQLSRYDPFLNDFFGLQKDLMLNDCDFINMNSSLKNIIYLNKPSDIEKFAIRLSAIKTDVNCDNLLSAIKDIADYVHPQYNLIKFLKKGIIYHHGSVPDSIRLYIEKIYTESPEVKYVITNSTLLQGVNLPADRMFLLDNKHGRGNLSPSDFKNLIGRVSRFSDIFTENSSLGKLAPHIYLVNSQYYSKTANIKKFIADVFKIDKKVSDSAENVLLVKTEINDDNKEKYESSLEFIENYELGTIDDSRQIRMCNTDIGKSCFANNVTEIKVLDVEDKLKENLEIFSKENPQINDASVIMNALLNIFFEHISEFEQDDNLSKIARLKHIETQNFYSMFLNWRIKGATYNEMISSFLRHWNSIIDNKKDTLVYVGRWGDIVRNGHQKLWTDIRDKDIDQRINLAIVRIKEEQDFLDNTLIKYIEVLNDMNLINEDLYLKIKYGTNNKMIITLIKNGLSLTLSKLIVEKYNVFVKIDIANDTVDIKKEIHAAMLDNIENSVLINEVTYFITDL